MVNPNLSREDRPVKKYRFAKNERYAVWFHHGQVCFWCGEPLRLQEVTIDHMIPENILDKPDQLEQTKKLFGLPHDFEVNDFCNWLPCHDRCNKSKGKHAPPSVPLYKSILDKLISEASKVRATATRIKEDANRDRLLGKVMMALENDVISLGDIHNLMSDLDEADADIGALKKEIIKNFDSGRWEIVALHGNIATVTDGRFGGIVPIVRNPDITWECPNCGCYGPWSGVRCLTCGQMSDPYD